MQPITTFGDQCMKDPWDYSNFEKIKIKKAKNILSRENSIQKIEDGLFLVQSESGNGFYKVDCRTDRWECNCPSFKKMGHINPCKHIVALTMAFHGIYSWGYEYNGTPKVTYDQSWADYNRAQSMEIELFDKFLYNLVSSIEEPKQDMGRPRHRLKDLVFCCVMKVYSQLSSRRSQCLFNQALEKNQISENIHYNALSRTLLKKDIKPVLKKLVHLSAQPLSSVEKDFAVDSSGFRCSTFGSYCNVKHRSKRAHNWLKVHICTGVNTNIVSDVVITDEYGGDSPQLKKLIKKTAEYFLIDEVSADMAYSSRKNYEIIGKYGGKGYIPFKKNARGASKKHPLWNRAYHYFNLHRDEFMEHYHKRSNVETTFSAIKKKFGENLKSRNRIAQENELLCKIIAYNITILIRELIEMGADPDIFKIGHACKEISMSREDYK